MQLCSVAFADELAIVYLLRKQALRDRIPMKCEQHPDKRNRKAVDVCFLKDGAFVAFCEIKICHIGSTNKVKESLQDDVEKILNLQCPAAPDARRYNAWVLTFEHEATPDPKEWVAQTIKGIAEIDQFEVSEPIPINRTGPEVTRWGKHTYGYLRVVVFSSRAPTS